MDLFLYLVGATEPRPGGIHERRTMERVTWAHANRRRIVPLLTTGTTTKKGTLKWKTKAEHNS